MTVFFAHVGSTNSARDFPRTIGTGATTVRMSKRDFGPFASLVPAGLSDFQTWGIPEKADPIHRKRTKGDWFLLVGTTGGGGGVDYTGKVVHIVPTRENGLSAHLWTEPRFPWIFFLKGEMTHIPWPVFLDRIGYAPNLDPRGRIYGISKEKMRKRGCKDDFDLIDALRK